MSCIDPSKWYIVIVYGIYKTFMNQITANEFHSDAVTGENRKPQDNDYALMHINYKDYKISLNFL